MKPKENKCKMKKTKRTLRWHPLSFYDPVYGVRYLVLWNVKDTPDEQAAILNYIQNEFDFKIEDASQFLFSDSGAAKTTSFLSGNIIIQFRFDTNPGAVALVHEAFHAMMAVFSWREVHLDSQDDEHGAYYIGWLCKAICKHGHKYNLWNKE